MNAVKHTYTAIMVFLWISYILSYFGVYYVNPQYTSYLSLALRLLVCGFLIFRFHPFQTHELRDFDARLIFASAVIILTDVGAEGTYGVGNLRFPYDPSLTRTGGSQGGRQSPCYGSLPNPPFYKYLGDN